VTRDGKPLADATVSFQPVEAGPGSTGKTNANGEFVLKTMNGERGAWVGEHRVSISLHAVGPEGGDRRGPRLEETIPERYNRKSDLTFKVPRGGTRNANFALESP
jgi:hypothetical protein